MDEWSVLHEFPKYSVSAKGEVRRDTTGRVLKSWLNRGGHPHVGFFEGGVQHKRSIAKLVAEAFVPNPDGPRFDTIIHRDGNLLNCHANNLLWRPRWFANMFTRQFEYRDGFHHAPIRDVATGQVYASVWDIVVQDGVLVRDVFEAIGNKTVEWSTKRTFEWA